MSNQSVSSDDQLPLFLTVRELQSILQVSRSETYVIAHSMGVTRVGPRLIRVTREKN